MNPLLSHVRRQLESLPPPTAYRLAYSGGVDSHVLLDCLQRLRPVLRADMTAVHVHHGLHADADGWTEHCRRECAHRGVPLEVVRVDARARRGQSPEAAARAARYRALAERLPAGGALLTGHHADDQAETVLLQLLRGSGPAGLAGMPAAAAFGAGWHLRPLLELSRDEVLAYARAQGLDWIEDSSNVDLRVDRSYLRRQVMPVLRARWPAAARTVGRAAANAADASALADALAETDLARCAGPRPDRLQVAALTALTPVRRHNVLRFWLRRLGLPPPQRIHLQRVVGEMLPARWDSNPVVHWPGAEVRRYRDVLYAMTPLAHHDHAKVLPWDWREPLVLDALGIAVQARAVTGSGIRRGALDGAARVQLGFRCGGERLRPAGRRGHRLLKHLLQEQGVPPWQRDRIPLIYVDGALAAVADLWVAGEFAAEATDPGVDVRTAPLPEFTDCGAAR